MRLDQLLVERGLADSRARAQALVLAGKVRVGEGDSARMDRKPGDLVDVAIEVGVAAPDPYVSRGGHKLAAALDAFEIDPASKVCLDVGASTGGFTDVLLQRGARRVYALDVGRGQLAEAFRGDGRVVSIERTNARTLTSTSLPEPIDLVVIDVSFISLALVLPPVATTLEAPPNGAIVALVKPQFEAGRERRAGHVAKNAGMDRGIPNDTIADLASARLELWLHERHDVAAGRLERQGDRCEHKPQGDERDVHARQRDALRKGVGRERPSVHSLHGDDA